MTTTKADLAKHVTERAGVTKSQARTFLDALLAGIVETLRAGNRVELRGFGSFRTLTHSAFLAANPRTATASLARDGDQD